MAARELGTPAANQRLAQRAALMTRAHKREVDSEALRENWEKQAVDLGFDARALAAEAIAKGAVSPDMGKEAWWLERRFPEQFGRRDQMEHTGGVKVQATQTQERKLTIELVNSDGEVHRITRDDNHGRYSGQGSRDCERQRSSMTARYSQPCAVQI